MCECECVFALCGGIQNMHECAMVSHACTLNMRLTCCSVSVYDEAKQKSCSLAKHHRVAQNFYRKCARTSISHRNGIAVLRSEARITFNSPCTTCSTVVIVCILLFIFACTLAIIYFEIFPFGKC